MFSRLLVLAVPAAAYTANNQPFVAGDLNFPNVLQRGVFQAEMDRPLPVVNVKYHFPASDVVAFNAGMTADRSFNHRVQEVFQQSKADAGLIGDITSGLSAAVGRASFLADPTDAIASALGSAKIYSTYDPRTEDINELIKGIGHVAAPRPHVDTTSTAAAPSHCVQDYSDRCPVGWRSVGQTSCSPTAGYSGPCQSTVNFAQYNAKMLGAFSNECGAYWKCAA